MNGGQLPRTARVAVPLELAKPIPGCGIERISNDTDADPSHPTPPRRWRWWKVIHNFVQVRLIYKSMGSTSTHPPDSGGIETNEYFFGNAQVVHLRWINKVENIHADGGTEQMTITIFRRRSINLDDRTHERGKLLAKNKAVSLSALLRLIINEAYKQYGSRPC